MKRWISFFLAAVLFFTCIPLDVLAAEKDSDQVISLTVTNFPDKRSYMPGDAPDMTGLTAEAAYSSGTVKSLSAADLTVDAPKKMESGDQTIVVSYGGQSASFAVHVHTVRILEAVAPTYTQSGLTEGKDCSACGMLLQAQEKVAVKAAPNLGKPVISAKVTSDGVRISWNTVENAEFYQVHRKNAGGEWMLLGSVSGTEYLDATADSGVRVYYSVRACINTAEGVVRSSKSSNKSVFFVAATLSNTASGVSIEWMAVEDASYYRVYRRIPGGSWETLSSKTTGTSFLDKTAESGVTYQYAVRAYDTSAMTNYNYDLELTRLVQPDISVSNRSGGIRVTWKKVSGAEGYDVYRQISGGSWQLLDTVAASPFLDESAQSGITYTYMVRARKGTSLSGSKDKASILRLSRPEPSVSVVYSGVSVQWTAVEGAESYQVMRRVPGGSWEKIASGIKALKYTDKTVKSGETYQYSVRAYGDGVYSGYIATKSIGFLSRPSVSAKTISTTSVKLTWKEVEGADRYVIYLKNGESWKEYATVIGTSYTAGDLKFGETYTFGIRAFSDGARSTRSKSVSGKATYPAPSYELELEPKEGIRISWSAVEGAGSYRVYRRTSGGSWKFLKTTTQTAYVDDTGKPGTTYEYAVRAFELEGAKGIYGIRAEGKTIVFSMIDPNKPMVALTFDDGPSKYTATILDQLEKYGAHATFFVVGNRVASYPKTLKRAYELGCEIGNHSWSHPSLSSISVSAMKQEISKTDEAVEKVLGIKPDLLRPPYGAVDDDVKKYAGKPLIHWSIDTRDWEHRTKSKTVSSVLNNVRDGSIVLMHDIYSATAEAAVVLIPALIQKGYQLVTVSELAEYRGVNLKDGKIYYSFRP